MDSSTLSQAADLIIVFCFAAIIGAAAGNVLGKLICWIKCFQGFLVLFL